jgi:apolipoprotein N-acyltransferase
MKFPRLTRLLPNWKNAALAILSAILLILAFPDLDLWFLAWFAVAPLLWAIRRQSESTPHLFVLGWLWGFVFFTGTSWWLTFAPITYAGFPTWLAYLLLLCVTAVVGIFPGLFAVALAFLLRRFGGVAILAAPFVWVFTEFLRYWIVGNNWNAIGYSQGLGGTAVRFAAVGGVLLVGFFVVLGNTFFVFWTAGRRRYYVFVIAVLFLGFAGFSGGNDFDLMPLSQSQNPVTANLVAIQPNVPMSGLSEAKWRQLRGKHLDLAESALATINQRRTTTTTVIFPESPMNFMWEEDEEFRNFVHVFANKHDVQVLFNSAEPDAPNNKYFNSAVLVGPDGREVAQYDKIYLLPFGESVPSPLQSIVPAFVGSFSYGKEYDLLPLGEARAGVMICFESHFGQLSREYVRNGADVLIEMTNDGYLGPTPVLRQHLANAVFRAVETNRPVLRVTNVGITAYINERGEVRESADPYTEATRVWSVAKSDGSRTFYVKYGDWFAWVCSVVTLLLLAMALIRKPVPTSE